MKAFIKKHRFKLVSLAAAVSFTFNIILLLVMFPAVRGAFSASKTAVLGVTVTEYGGAAIEGATVCIIETAGYYKTDANGRTEPIKVPVTRNSNFDTSLPRPYGEVTVFVYKDGYIDYVLFYVMVFENKTRGGLPVRLYPTGDPENAIPHSLIEGPDNNWVKELIKKYRK